ncbi:hypothetical protein B7486_20120 [cyanobacterium TDX16]|nr:hypothetical protein B7486_20120 [cyanobacterium TDX16]
MRRAILAFTFVFVLSHSSGPTLADDISSDRVIQTFDHISNTIRVTFLGQDDKARDTLTIAIVTFDGKPQGGFQPQQAESLTLQNDVLRIKLEPLNRNSVAITWTALDGKPHDFVIPIKDNSDYYGCGERFGSLNHKGLILPMVSIDRPEAKGSVTYKPVPFYMSTRGYGLFVESFEPGSFDFNATDRDHVLLKYRASRLRIVFIDGPDFASILDDYTDLSGRPRVPPAWSFAPWKSRNVHNNREEVLADAELTRKHDLPGSVIVIDSPWETGYNDFTLNEKQFREPEAMFGRLRELGFHTCLWLTPFINSENLIDMEGIDKGPSKNFAEASERGYLVKRPDGKPMIVNWWKGDGGLVDFTNPEAVKWWHDQIDIAREWRFAALKCDDGEGNFVQDAVFHDGSTASEMKNRYATLYLDAAQKYIDERLSGDGVLFARCGFSGTQRFPFCWAGDNEASFSFENGLPTVILAGQNAALSGIPFWGHDIAGYTGEQSKELFIRWTQFGALSPCMQVHMTSNLGPWDFGEEALAIYRKFAKLHTSLFPYIYDAAHEASRTGMPIIRPMILAFQNDPAAASHRYQYMFGPDLLVAPMYQPGTHRAVYLPKRPDNGEWLNYWSGKNFTGGQTIEADVPLDLMPLFVRAGAIIPMLPEEIDTLIPRHAAMSKDVIAIDYRRVLQVWPGPDGSITTSGGITAGTTRAEGKVLLQLTSKDPRTVEVRRRVDATAAPKEDEGWRRDAAGQWWCKPVVVGPEPIVVTWAISE